VEAYPFAWRRWASTALPVGDLLRHPAHDEYGRLTRRRRRPSLIEDIPEEDWQAIEKAHAVLAKGEPRP
jgi:hypothetical protein